MIHNMMFTNLQKKYNYCNKISRFSCPYVRHIQVIYATSCVWQVCFVYSFRFVTVYVWVVSVCGRFDQKPILQHVWPFTRPCSCCHSRFAPTVTRMTFWSFEIKHLNLVKKNRWLVVMHCNIIYRTSIKVWFNFHGTIPISMELDFHNLGNGFPSITGKFQP